MVALTGTPGLSSEELASHCHDFDGGATENDVDKVIDAAVSTCYDIFPLSEKCLSAINVRLSCYRGVPARPPGRPRCGILRGGRSQIMTWVCRRDHGACKPLATPAGWHRPACASAPARITDVQDLRSVRLLAAFAPSLEPTTLDACNVYTQSLQAHRSDCEVEEVPPGLVGSG